MAAAAGLLLVSVTEGQVVHPRLLFGPEDIPGLREKVRREPWSSMFAHLKKTAGSNDRATGPLDPTDDYHRITAGQREAFLYVLTGDDSHAGRAREHATFAIQSSDWANRRVKGLTLYYVGKGLALMYDWCHGSPSWDEGFCRSVSRKLLDQADAVYESGGREQNRSLASNWQGLRFSTAGLMYLATDEPVDRARIERCHGVVRGYLLDNTGPSAQSRGWNAEGLGYTYYPMGNGVGPFAVAMHRADASRDLREVGGGARMMLWTVYAALVRNADGSLWRPDFGDDNPGADAEGTMGFAFWFCPPELHPGLAWWYDRTVGLAGNKTFDQGRFGTIASILYHPGDAVAPADPLSIPLWRRSMIDTEGNGYFTYRNAYRDQTDIVAQVFAKFRGNRGHNGPDALSFRVVGMNTIWATGGGRYGLRVGGVDVYKRSMNTLYPGDPDGPLRTGSLRGRLVGQPVLHGDGGGAVTLAIQQNNLGVDNHVRRFAVGFPGTRGDVPSHAGTGQTDPAAVMVIVDTSDNGKVWQMVTLRPNAITTEANRFTITAPDGASLRGTVIHPPARAIGFKVGSRPRGSNAGDIRENNFLHFGSDDGCYVVVMTIAPPRGAHPNVTAEGTWAQTPRGVIRVGGWRFDVSQDAIQRLP